MRTEELLARLQRHYIKPGEQFPGGIFLPEVGWNGRSGGRVDALYVGFTSTSGRRLVGHELKVSRSDWRHELDQPGKADGWHARHDLLRGGWCPARGQRRGCRSRSSPSRGD